MKILDHGLIRLDDHMGNDLTIVRKARMSRDAAWRAGLDKGSDDRLIGYLYRNKHTTPFESVVFTFEVKAPIFVFRQWQRHRTQGYSEASARYTELPEIFYVPKAEHIATQSKSNKQARDISDSTTEQAQQNVRNSRRIDRHCAAAFREYRILLEDGVPRELARSVLPMATYSHMFATVNLHNLFGFLRERLAPGAQYEIRVYADAMLKLITPIVPVAVEAFKKDFFGT